MCTREKDYLIKAHYKNYIFTCKILTKILIRKKIKTEYEYIIENVININGIKNNSFLFKEKIEYKNPSENKYDKEIARDEFNQKINKIFIKELREIKKYNDEKKY